MTYIKLKSKDKERTQQTNVIFFGANFDNEFPAKNLYKALNVAKPDCVMVQLSPDYLLSNFNQRPMRFDYADEKWNFCKQKYIDQLLRDGHELYPSLKSKLKMVKLLKESGIVIAPSSRPETDLNE